MMPKMNIWHHNFRVRRDTSRVLKCSRFCLIKILTPGGDLEPLRLILKISSFELGAVWRTWQV